MAAISIALFIASLVPLGESIRHHAIIRQCLLNLPLVAIIAFIPVNLCGFSSLKQMIYGGILGIIGISINIVSHLVLVPVSYLSGSGFPGIFWYVFSFAGLLFFVIGTIIGLGVEEAARMRRRQEAKYRKLVKLNNRLNSGL